MYFFYFFKHWIHFFFFFLLLLTLFKYVHYMLFFPTWILVPCNIYLAWDHRWQLACGYNLAYSHVKCKWICTDHILNKTRLMCPTAVTTDVPSLPGGGGPCWGLYLVLIETESQLLSVAHIQIGGIHPNEALFISLPLSVLSLSAPQRIVSLLSSPLKFMKRRRFFFFSGQCHTGRGLMPAGWLSSVRCRVSVLLKQSDLVLYWLPREGDALVPAEDDLLTAESQGPWQDLSS